jgi:lysozyme family protein
MTDVKALVAANAARWSAMHLDAHRIASFDATAKRLAELKPRLLPISVKTGVEWWVIAVILEREASGRTDRYLGNGQRLGAVTTEVPAGRGPFFGADAFERGCLDALIDCAPHTGAWHDWSSGGTLTALEEYNGLGYAARGKPSPYVWSGTDQYTRGKYVADHVYDPNAVDQQEGCAAIIARMMVIDPSIGMGTPPNLKPVPPTPAADKGPAKAAPPPPFWEFVLTLLSSIWSHYFGGR